MNLLKNRILVLIDGFNYYHRLDEFQEKYNICVKWLNYRKLIESWLTDNDDKATTEIIYFSAKAKHRGKESVNRHNVYIQALEQVNIQVVLGMFKPKWIKPCKNCPIRQPHQKIQSHEEKNTDVNIAITLLEYTLKDMYDKCLILSSDNDFRSVIIRAKTIAPNKRIIICPPPPSRMNTSTNPILKREYRIDALEKASGNLAKLSHWRTFENSQFDDDFNGLINPWQIKSTVTTSTI